MKTFMMCVMLAAAALSGAWAAPISRDPYIGAIAIDAHSGQVLFEDGADRPGYPASMVKLMDLFLVLDRVKAGSVRLTDSVRVTKEAADMGGSQVWLDPREHFPVEDLLYALIVQSANDAAMALAIHVGGSREEFVGMMNQKARELGLSAVTRFQSPHGLPPGGNRRPDITTPRDFAVLCRALLAAHPEALKYTSTDFRLFREASGKPFEMRTHNRLLGKVEGCDGLKTGYFRDAGYSIAATAERNGARVIVVVMGSRDREQRDAKAAEWLNRALLEASRPPPTLVPPPPPPAPPDPVWAQADAEPTAEADSVGSPEPKGRSGWKTVGWVLLIVVLGAVIGMVVQRRLLMATR
ncbi:MAG: D-alanyl-D-alanine carboxypeptidase [Verrucomicrobiota bacterium]|jgi:D-alanyl-D-alanine carboxypeptidase (penicillin-binding protein 5/6)|nr:D-alanyl-D-alanine carboxypeptidase [Verrucomicrobiota bacterium]